jgi:hypothetical protein
MPPAADFRHFLYPAPDMVDAAVPAGRVHPGDERHLAGAFQDNRVIPYEGIRVGGLDRRALDLVDAIVADFTGYLPAGPAAARRREIAAHYGHTWFSWIGGFGEGEPFYYRIQSPWWSWNWTTAAAYSSTTRSRRDSTSTPSCAPPTATTMGANSSGRHGGLPKGCGPDRFPENRRWASGRHRRSGTCFT